jgi:hypothetical protein
MPGSPAIQEEIAILTRLSLVADALFRTRKKQLIPFDILKQRAVKARRVDTIPGSTKRAEQVSRLRD